MPDLTLKHYHALTGQWSNSAFLDLNRGSEDPGARGLTPNQSETLTDAEMFESVRTVPDNYGVATLWEDGDGGFTTYDTLWIESDKDVLLSLGSTADASAERIKIAANIPVHLAVNQVAAVGTLSDVEATVMTAVDEIKVKRNVADGEGDATIRLILFKDNSA